MRRDAAGPACNDSLGPGPCSHNAPQVADERTDSAPPVAAGNRSGDPAREQLAEQVQRELPSHGGIIRAAQGIAEAAHEAKRVARALRRPWGLHRLPAAFAAVALLLFAAWIYWNFFYVATLSIALPKEDASQLYERLSHGGRVRFAKTITEGSRESLQLLLERQGRSRVRPGRDSGARRSASPPEPESGTGAVFRASGRAPPRRCAADPDVGRGTGQPFRGAGVRTICGRSMTKCGSRTTGGNSARTPPTQSPPTWMRCS